MRKIARRWRTVLLALPVIGALGFGAGQALAAPDAAPARGRGVHPGQVLLAGVPVRGRQRHLAGRLPVLRVLMARPNR